MEDFLVFEVEVFKVFLLVMVRITGLIVSAPLLGSGNFPVLGKIGLAGLTAMLVTPSITALNQTLPNDLLSYGVLAVGELAIGMLMGFVMTLVFAALQVGGQIMDMQSGFGLVNVFNPAFETQFPIFGFFLFILTMLFLLVFNGHHVMLRAVIATFEKVPLGGFAFRPALFWEVSRWGEAIFVDGLLIAAPVTAALFLAYFAMGVMGRVVPQIQLFAVGFPLTIAVALFVTAMSLGMYLSLLDGMFARMFRNVASMINGMT